MGPARTKIQLDAQRVAREIKRAIGADVRQQREDLGIAQSRLAEAAGISPSFLCRIESGDFEPSIHVLAAIGAALGGRVRVRMEPGTGSPLRDHLQARMVEALLKCLHPRWRRFLEVPLYRPVHGVIDAVLDDRLSPVMVASEFHSQLRRLEAQVRWANEKADALVETDVFRASAASSDAARVVSRLLVLRSSHAMRDLARTYSSTLASAYPARAADVHAALTAEAPWPGSGIVWMRLDRRDTILLHAPPRGVDLGR